jgi:hypothetical protein
MTSLGRLIKGSYVPAIGATKAEGQLWISTVKEVCPVNR